MIRLVRVEASGIDLFENSSLALDFYASDRVINPRKNANPGSVHRLGANSSIYTENVVGIAGINASGKTSTLKLLNLALNVIGGNLTLRSDLISFNAPIARAGNEFSLSVIFWHDNAFYLLESTFDRHRQVKIVADGDVDSPTVDLGYAILDETLWQGPSTRVNRSMLSSSGDFKSVARVIMKRNGDNDDPTVLDKKTRSFLAPDTSIVQGLGMGSIDVGVPTRQLLEDTLPDGVVQVFDGSIERMEWDPTSEVFHLKFKDGPERTVSRGVAKQMLSTGTVVGSEMVTRAIQVLRNGGFMIIDEIEQSLNKSLAGVVMGLFTSPKTNPRGAQLVFTTHYVQLLDNLQRSDNIYLLTRNDNFKTRALKYSDAFKRDDYKKSEVIMSNTIKGMNPRYEDVERLNAYVAEHIGGAK